jgi:hypothetical protein
MIRYQSRRGVSRAKLVTIYGAAAVYAAIGGEPPKPETESADEDSRRRY